MAAAAAARLASRAGWAVAWRGAGRRRVPAILLSDAARRFLAGVFEEDLFRGAHRVRKRVVAWGGGPAVTLEHSAVVVSEQQLLDRLRPQSGDVRDGAAWVIRTVPGGGDEHRFGSRIANVWRVEVEDDSACAIESLEAGWLFLVPEGGGSGWLLAVGDAGLEQSGVIRRMIRGRGAAAGEFPAYPKIAMPLGGAGWLGCGSAAMAFDPICGDGAANAVRQAILAAAVASAALKGEDAAALIDHYQKRLKLGFKRHLLLCREYYRSGGEGAWWRQEVAALERGIAWCGGEASFAYRLEGYELRRI